MKGKIGIDKMQHGGAPRPCQQKNIREGAPRPDLWEEVGRQKNLGEGAPRPDATHADEGRRGCEREEQLEAGEIESSAAAGSWDGAVAPE